MIRQISEQALPISHDAIFWIGTVWRLQIKGTFSIHRFFKLPAAKENTMKRLQSNNLFPR